MAETAHPWFKATDHDGNGITSELMEFAELYGLQRAAPGRYSLLLLFGLYHGAHARRLNPGKVVQEIEMLEGLRTVSRTKPASVFDRNAPLRGLWHKHYVEDGLPSVARNLQKAIRKYGVPSLERKAERAEIAGEDCFLSVQDALEIADDASVQNWTRLMQDSGLTGQWLIYARYGGQNYYLCLGRHGTGDQQIRDQIEAVCIREFPFLGQILTQPEG